MTYGELTYWYYESDLVSIIILIEQLLKCDDIWAITYWYDETDSESILILLKCGAMELIMWEFHHFVVEMAHRVYLDFLRLSSFLVLFLFSNPLFYGG